VIFVDHTAEYAVASDQAVDGHGGWPVLVVGGALVESLMQTFLRGLEPEPEADHRVSAVQALMVRLYRVRQVWCKSVCSVFSVVGLGC
jgi:hypothetical protein